MKLDDSARALIGSGADATLVTLNPDGSPQVSVVWVALQSTPDGDELVSAHLADYKKLRNVRRDPRVAATILAAKSPGQQTPYLAIPAQRASSRAALRSYSRNWPRRCSAQTSTSPRPTRRRATSPASGSTRWAASVPGRPDAS